MSLFSRDLLPSKKALKGTVLISGGNILSQAIGFVFLTLLARWMSKNDYGMVGYVITVATLATTVISAGLPTAMTRFLAKSAKNREEMNDYFTNISALFIIMLVLTELVVAIIYWNNIIVLAVVLGFSIPSIYMGIIRGLMQYAKFSIYSVLTNVIKICVLIALFYTIGIKDYSVLLIYAFAGWGALLVIELLMRSKLKVVISKISKARMKEIMLFSLPIFITTIGYSVVTSIPVIILEYCEDYSSVALFSIAYLFVTVYTFVPIAILTILMPDIAAVKSNAARQKLFSQSFLLILGTGIVFLIGTVLLGKFAIQILFTSRYADSFIPLVILAIGANFMCIRNTFSALWEGGGKPVFSTIDTVSGAIVAVAAGFLFIPLYGVAGAAIAFTLGWCVSSIISTFFLYRYRTGKIILK